MLTEKYLAGLVDADGSVGIRFFRRDAGGFRPAMFFQVSQHAEKDKVLHLLADSFGGSVYYKNGTTGFGGTGGMAEWRLPHTAGKKLLGRIEKFLVVKRARAKLFLKYLDEVQIVPPEMLQTHQKQLREAMRVQHQLPNYPARKWLAGYFDGDGCFASRLNRKGHAYLSARITAHKDADAGIRLLHKAFGGAIYYNRGEHLPMWVLHLEPSKAKEFIGFFAKHLVTKKDEAYFILGCVNGGNYRDGETIHSTLRQLKAQGQRPNESGVDVSHLLRQVRFDVEDGRGKHRRKRWSGTPDGV